MSYTVSATRFFQKQLKSLRKKYPSLDADLQELKDTLQIEPLQGVDLGHNLRKIRLAITSKNQGKSGGARVITYNDIILNLQEGNIFLISIYDKSEMESIEIKRIKQLMAAEGL